MIDPLVSDEAIDLDLTSAYGFFCYCANTFLAILFAFFLYDRQRLETALELEEGLLLEIFEDNPHPALDEAYYTELARIETEHTLTCNGLEIYTLVFSYSLLLFGQSIHFAALRMILHYVLVDHSDAAGDCKFAIGWCLYFVILTWALRQTKDFEFRSNRSGARYAAGAHALHRWHEQQHRTINNA